MAAVGETVIEEDVVAALAEPVNMRTHSRTAVAAKKIPATFGLFESHLEDCNVKFRAAYLL
jgi:hypothetical protein